MTDLFDRVAARALGLGMALRPRMRSRFEPESLASEFDSVVAGGGGDAPPLASPPTREEMGGQARFGAEAATRRASQARSTESDVLATERKSRTASSDGLEKAGPVQGASRHPTTQQDRRSLPPAAVELPPESVELGRSSDPAIKQNISWPGNLRVQPAGVPPNVKSNRHMSQREDAGSDFDRPSHQRLENEASLASAPPMSPFFEREAPGRSAPPDPAASRYENERYSAPQEPTRDDQRQPARRPQAGRPAREVDAARAPEIEITIGRLEIRAESPAPARQAKPFQPHLDLAAYRARRKGGP